MKQNKFFKVVGFKCPDCGHNILIEELSNIKEYTKVSGIEYVDGIPYIFTDAIDEETGVESNYDESYQSAYFCNHCGLRVASNATDVYNWLEKHNMLHLW